MDAYEILGSDVILWGEDRPSSEAEKKAEAERKPVAQVQSGDKLNAATKILTSLFDAAGNIGKGLVTPANPNLALSQPTTPTPMNINWPMVLGIGAVGIGGIWLMTRKTKK